MEALTTLYTCILLLAVYMDTDIRYRNRLGVFGVFATDRRMIIRRFSFVPLHFIFLPFVVRGQSRSSGWL